MQLISSGTCDDDYDKDGNLFFTSEIMVKTVDDNGNTIGNNNQLCRYNSDSDHTSHLVCDVIRIKDFFLDYDCVGFGNFINSTNLSN